MFVTVENHKGDRMLALPAELVASRKGEAHLVGAIDRAEGDPSNAVRVRVYALAGENSAVRLDMAHAERCPEAVARFVRAYCAATP